MKFLTLISAAFLFSVTPSFADWTNIQGREFSLPPYPTEGSAEYKKDFELLHQYQNERSKESCALARRQKFPTFDAFFADRASPLSEAEASKSESLVTKVMRVVIRAADFQKEKYQRTRPYDADVALRPCIDLPGGHRSYPSAHAAAAAGAACALAEIFPSKAKLIRSHGDHLGELRVIAGVHHPSDVAAGQKLGREVCASILRESDFQLEVRKLRE